MEHYQALKCENCGTVYEVRWKTEADLALVKVHGVLVCVVCENAVCSRGLGWFIKGLTE